MKMDQSGLADLNPNGVQEHVKPRNKRMQQGVRCRFQLHFAAGTMQPT